MTEDPHDHETLKHIMQDIKKEIGRLADNTALMMQYSRNMISPKLMLIIVGIIAMAFSGAEGLRLLSLWVTSLVKGA